ncbi:hypothetical protein [Deinococcus radiophilus]
MSAEMLSQAGVDSDIAAMVSQPPVAQAPQAKAHSWKKTSSSWIWKTSLSRSRWT